MYALTVETIDNDQAVIYPKYVTHLTPRDGGTTIHFISGSVLLVKVPIAELTLQIAGSEDSWANA